VGVVTSISIAHTQGLGSLAAVAAEKASLLWALPPAGTAIYPSASQAPGLDLSRVRAHKLSFGSDEQAQVVLRACELMPDATSVCAFELPGGRTLSAELSLFGPGPALDAAAALAVVSATLGAEAVASASLGLSRVAPAPGRLEPVPGPAKSLILDDSYNANPASTAASLHALCALASARGGRALCALGDMRELGEHSREQHELVGRLLAELGVARFVGCGAEMAVAVAAARAASPALEVAHVSDATAVATLLRPHLRAGDVLLIKGSRSMGMERAVDELAELDEPAPGGGAA
jgi:UDP-N-acetylmuramoyl-tripeptide--D-alanyl-D-alanine ligase